VQILLVHLNDCQKFVLLDYDGILAKEHSPDENAINALKAL